MHINRKTAQVQTKFQQRQPLDVFLHLCPPLTPSSHPSFCLASHRLNLQRAPPQSLIPLNVRLLKEQRCTDAPSLTSLGLVNGFSYTVTQTAKLRALPQILCLFIDLKGSSGLVFLLLLPATVPQ